MQIKTYNNVWESFTSDSAGGGWRSLSQGIDQGGGLVGRMRTHIDPGAAVDEPRRGAIQPQRIRDTETRGK